MNTVFSVTFKSGAKADAIYFLEKLKFYAKRKENWKPRTPKVTTGYLARYASLVTSGNRGAVLEIKQ